MIARSQRWVLAVCVVGAGWLALAPGGTAGAQRRHLVRARLSQGCPDSGAPVNGAAAATLRAAVVCLINQERAAHGLPGLRQSSRLDYVAQRHTQAMVHTGYFGHGAEFTLRFSAAGYNWRAAGENIASGYSTPSSVVAAWMASPGHCRNILNPAFRDVGTGVTAAAVGVNVGPGTWTQDFGLLMGQSPPSGNTRAENGCPY